MQEASFPPLRASPACAETATITGCMDALPQASRPIGLHPSSRSVGSLPNSPPPWSGRCRSLSSRLPPAGVMVSRWPWRGSGRAGRTSGELVWTFTIITTIANEVLRSIHDRMPLVLEPTNWRMWLDKGQGKPLRPAADDVLIRWPVSSRVNSPNHDGSELLDEVAEPGAQDQEEAGPDSAWTHSSFI